MGSSLSRKIKPMVNLEEIYGPSGSSGGHALLKDVTQETMNNLVCLGNGVFTYQTVFNYYGGWLDISNRGVLVLLPPLQVSGKNRLVSLNPANIPDRVLEQIHLVLEHENAVLSDVITLCQRHWLFMSRWKAAFPLATMHVPPGHIPEQEPAFEYQVMKSDLDNPLPQFAPHLKVSAMAGIRALDSSDSSLPKTRELRWELLAYYPRGNMLFSGDTLEYLTQNSWMGYMIGIPSHKLFCLFTSVGQWKFIGNYDSFLKSMTDFRLALEPSVGNAFGGIKDDSQSLFLSIHFGLGSILVGNVKASFDKLLVSLNNHKDTPPKGWKATMDPTPTPRL